VIAVASIDLVPLDGDLAVHALGPSGDGLECDSAEVADTEHVLVVANNSAVG
jgi:hypothetical protein